jgi:amino acid transporter
MGGLEHAMNVIALIFVVSAANTDLYISSRILYGLALEGKAPVVFKRVNRLGVPYAALGASVVVACFGFLSIVDGTGEVFTSLTRLCSTFGALAWSEFCHQTPKFDTKTYFKVCITYTHIRFMRALKVKGIDRRQQLPWTSPFQPWAVWVRN